MKDANKPAVEIKYQLHTPVREDLFDYFISWLTLFLLKII
jgi:hypothetical protein